MFALTNRHHIPRYLGSCKYTEMQHETAARKSCFAASLSRLTTLEKLHSPEGYMQLQPIRGMKLTGIEARCAEKWLLCCCLFLVAGGGTRKDLEGSGCVTATMGSVS